MRYAGNRVPRQPYGVAIVRRKKLAAKRTRASFGRTREIIDILWIHRCVVRASRAHDMSIVTRTAGLT
jgi:hypothetical protein